MMEAEPDLSDAAVAADGSDGFWDAREPENGGRISPYRHFTAREWERFRADTPLRTIEALRPDVLAKGGDWALDDIVGREAVESWGGRVVRLREVPGVRTSGLVAKTRRS